LRTVVTASQGIFGRKKKKKRREGAQTSLAPRGRKREKKAGGRPEREKSSAILSLNTVIGKKGKEIGKKNSLITEEKEKEGEFMRKKGRK